MGQKLNNCLEVLTANMHLIEVNLDPTELCKDIRKRNQCHNADGLFVGYFDNENKNKNIAF
jgi:hypothetical protein